MITAGNKCIPVIKTIQPICMKLCTGCLQINTQHTIKFQKDWMNNFGTSPYTPIVILLFHPISQQNPKFQYFKKELSKEWKDYDQTYTYFIFNEAIVVLYAH